MTLGVLTAWLLLLLLLLVVVVVVAAVHDFGVGWGVDARGDNLDMFGVTAHACFCVGRRWPMLRKCQ